MYGKFGSRVKQSRVKQSRVKHRSADSFIFSFENGSDIKYMRVSRPTNNNYAIFENYNNGFNFGNCFYMSDQYVYLQYSGNYNNYVINSNTSDVFVPEEIELFNVISL